MKRVVAILYRLAETEINNSTASTVALVPFHLMGIGIRDKRKK
jgi:hypothetical protein